MLIVYGVLLLVFPFFLLLSPLGIGEPHTEGNKRTVLLLIVGEIELNTPVFLSTLNFCPHLTD
jgi:formate hydrogenlyase subunit 4